MTRYTFIWRDRDREDFVVVTSGVVFDQQGNWVVRTNGQTFVIPPTSVHMLVKDDA